MRQRIIWIDIIRVVACFLVVLVHIRSLSDSVSTSLFDYLLTYVARSGVPLFLMISGVLLLPMKGSSKEFISSRFIRIVIPFLVWSVVYVTVTFIRGEISLADLAANILTIPFHLAAPHLWYIYLIIGLYLLVPVLSRWLTAASKTEVRSYLLLWLATIAFSYVNMAYPDLKTDEYNPMYIFYYFSGYIGYFLIGYYIVKYVGIDSLRQRILTSGALVISGAAIFALFVLAGFHHFKLSSYLTYTCVFNSVAIFIILKDITLKGALLSGAVIEISKMSFGIYLVHQLLIDNLVPLLNLNVFSGMARIVTAIIVFALSYTITKAISYIPYSKYIIG